MPASHRRCSTPPQQIGGALGLAGLATLSTRAANNELPDAGGSFFHGIASGDGVLVQRAAAALTHGYTTAFAGAGFLLLAGLVVAVTTINAKRQSAPTGEATPVQEPAATA